MTPLLASCACRIFWEWVPRMFIVHHFLWHLHCYKYCTKQWHLDMVQSSCSPLRIPMIQNFFGSKQTVISYSVSFLKLTSNFIKTRAVAISRRWQNGSDNCPNLFLIYVLIYSWRCKYCILDGRSSILHFHWSLNGVSKVLGFTLMRPTTLVPILKNMTSNWPNCPMNSRPSVQNIFHTNINRCQAFSYMILSSSFNPFLITPAAIDTSHHNIFNEILDPSLDILTCSGSWTQVPQI